jgi:hypothetical protein
MIKKLVVLVVLAALCSCTKLTISLESYEKLCFF